MAAHHLSINQLERLLKAIRDTFTITGEYTFEANPDELTKEKSPTIRKIWSKQNFNGRSNIQAGVIVCFR